MKETYLFEDWTSVSQFKNSYNPDLKAKCSVICDCGCITGYILTIYNSKDDQILYRVNINNSTSGVWSISTEEAVQLMNDVGFFCKYEEFGLSKMIEKNLDLIKSFKSLGYAYIHRTIRPLEVTLYREVKKNVDPRTQPGDSLKIVMDSFNYNDWASLPLGVCLSINKLLEVVE